MVAYTKPQHRKKEESEQLRGERDKIKFIDLRFERWQVVTMNIAQKSRDITSSHWRSLRRTRQSSEYKKACFDHSILISEKLYAYPLRVKKILLRTMHTLTGTSSYTQTSLFVRQCTVQ